MMLMALGMEVMISMAGDDNGDGQSMVLHYDWELLLVTPSSIRLAC